jgi:hypothetical protein
MLLVCALMAVTAPVAEARPLSAEKVHARIAGRGLGNWVGVELQNGTAFAGRIVSIDQDSFGLQLHNDPEVTPVLYRDVVCLHTGLSRGGFWAVTLAGFAGIAVMAAVGFSMVHKEQQQMPTLPSQPTQPVFP